MSVPAPQGYDNARGTEPVAGPSDYSRPQPQPAQHPTQSHTQNQSQPYVGVNGGHSYSSSQPRPVQPSPQPQMQQPSSRPPIQSQSQSQSQYQIDAARPYSSHRTYQAQYAPPGYPDMHGPGIPAYRYAAGGGNMEHGNRGFQYDLMSAPPPPVLIADNRADFDDKYEDSLENPQVKHRRRTTPEQLKVLEFWYDINPKPDNALREQLAAQLGMTKRNVQVWFQNRRAKMKGLAKKEAEDHTKILPNQPISGSHSDPIVPQTAYFSPYQSSLLRPPSAAGGNVPRRASLANGEAAKIEMFVAKRAAAQKQEEVMNGGSPATGVVGTGQANAARRGSIPYPTPTSAVPSNNAATSPLSPKFSPATRVTPSALHMAAIRNNTRRASVPGVAAGAQLISSGPFTPPRVVTNHQSGIGPGARELSTIEDHEVLDFSLSATAADGGLGHWISDVSPNTFLPPAEGFDPSMGGKHSFSHDASLPNPTFSFGSLPPIPNTSWAALPPPFHPSQSASEEYDLRHSQEFMTMQQRGRLGSIASINTMGTEGTEGDSSGGEWLVDVPEGFDPDARRASAPADLLHQIGIMGLSTLSAPPGNAGPIRPSPLNTHFTPESFHSQSHSGAGLLPHGISGQPHPHSHSHSHSHSYDQDAYAPMSASSTSTYGIPSHASSESMPSESPTYGQYEDQQHISPYSHHIAQGPGNGRSFQFSGFRPDWSIQPQREASHTSSHAPHLDSSHYYPPHNAVNLGPGDHASAGAGEWLMSGVPVGTTLGAAAGAGGGGQDGSGSGSDEGKENYSFLSDMGGMGGVHDAVNVLV